MSPSPIVKRAPSTEFRNICSPDELLKRKGVLDRTISNRARELAAAHGGAQEVSPADWAQAEAEVLRPISLQIEDFAEIVRIRADVAGFEADELRLSIEPLRIIIAGRKEHQPPEGNRLFYVDWLPDEILHVLQLPEDIDPALAKMKFRAGVLELELFKARDWPEWSTGIMDG